MEFPVCPDALAARARTPEAVKKSGLSQALARCFLSRKDLGDARLAVPAFFHSFPLAGVLEHHRIY